MIRSANHSSYPLGAGEARDEVAEAIVVAEQSRAFLDVVTDGQVRWSDPIAHVASCLRGSERTRPIALEAYRAAAQVTLKPVKVSLPGPATLVRETDGRHALQDVARALAEEIAELGAAGCRWFQLDEPLLSEDPEVEAACATVFDGAPAGSVTILFGPRRPERFAHLAGTHLGLDVTSDAGLALLGHLPPGRGVMLGLFDAGREEVEDAGAVAARLAPWRGQLEGRDLLLAPSGGLAALPRDAAFDKLLHARYLAETLRRSWTVSASPR